MFSQTGRGHMFSQMGRVCVCVAGGVSVLELKRSSMMQRLSGWMPTAIRGDQSPADLVLSLAVRELEEDSFIFALCQDHKLRMWSFRVRPSRTHSTIYHHTCCQFSGKASWEA